jgi:AAA domain
MCWHCGIRPDATRKLLRALGDRQPPRIVRRSKLMRRAPDRGWMMRRPTLFLTVGLPCTGKTTAARRIEIEQEALRLTKDEWVKALYGPRESDVGPGRDRGTAHRDRAARPRARQQRCHRFRPGESGRALCSSSGSSRPRRDDGAARYFELSSDEQRRRLDLRQAEAPHTTWPMSDEELAEWAANIDIPTPGELAGTEPIGDPPAGFTTWDEWREHRWPPSIR